VQRRSCPAKSLCRTGAVSVCDSLATVPVPWLRCGHVIPAACAEASGLSALPDFPGFVLDRLPGHVGGDRLAGL